MTAFDYAVLAVLCASLLLGVWRGVVSELLALLGWAAACVVAHQFGARLGELLHAWIGSPLLRWVAGMALAFVGTLLTMGLLRVVVAKLLRVVGLGPLDRFLGSLFGLLRAVLICLLGVLLAGLTALPQQDWWRNALFSGPLETAVVALKPWLPRDVAAQIHYR